MSLVFRKLLLITQDLLRYLWPLIKSENKFSSNLYNILWQPIILTDVFQIISNHAGLFIK